MNQEGRVLKGFNLEDLPNGSAIFLFHSSHWQDGEIAAMAVRDADLQFHVCRPYEVRNVERKELLKVLAAPLPDGTVQVNSKVVSISQESEGYTDVELEDGTILRTKVCTTSQGQVY